MEDIFPENWFQGKRSTKKEKQQKRRTKQKQQKRRTKQKQQKQQKRSSKKAF